MEQFCTSTANLMISAIFKDLNFNLFDNSSVLCMLVWCKTPWGWSEEDRNMSEY